MCGRVPFDGADEEALTVTITAGELTFKERAWANISDQAKNLIQRLLKVNPTERYDASEALRHPWITVHAVVNTGFELGSAHPSRVCDVGL